MLGGFDPRPGGGIVLGGKPPRGGGKTPWPGGGIGPSPGGWLCRMLGGGLLGGNPKLIGGGKIFAPL